MSKVVKTVLVVAAAVAVVAFAPAIAGALASVASSLGVTVAASALTAGIVGFGLSLALGAAMTLFRKTPSMSQSMVDRLNTSVVPTASRKIVFGTTAAGQDVRFFEGDVDLPSTKKDGYVQVIALASHRISSFRQFYVESDLVYQNGSWLTKRDGFAPNNPLRIVTEGRAGNGFAVGTGRYWKASASFTGCAYYVPFWKLDPDVWESGVPQRLTAIVDGCPLYDPRRDSTRGGSGTHRFGEQSTYAFSDGATVIGRNPALALLTYLIGWHINGKLVWGMGIPASRIDLDNFRTYANLCEERVATQDGGTVQRYTADAIYSTSDSHESVINSLTAAMGSCKLTDRGGTYCLVGGYDDTAGPKVDFTADDLVALANSSAPYIWNPAPASRERFNIVRGRFANPEELYQLTDWGEPIEQPPLADDVPRTLTLDLGAVSRAETCQRIAKQFLLREYICPGMFTATFGPKAFAVEVGSIITLSLPAEGWNKKLFRVMDQAETHDLIFQMTLREEDPAIYAWDREEKPLPPSIRPQGYDPSTTIAPAGLALTSNSFPGSNGINVSEVHVTWAPELSGRVSGIQIQSRPVGTSAWTAQAELFDPKAGSFTFTSNAPGIRIEVRARYRMTSAVYSAWVLANVQTEAVAISYPDVWDTPEQLGDINPAEGDKLEGIAPGADVTGDNISKDTAAVGGRPAIDVVKAIDDAKTGIADLFGTFETGQEIIDAAKAHETNAALAEANSAKARDDAQAASKAAGDAATAASGSASAANSAKAAAETAKTQATNAVTDAQAATRAAQTAQTAAETAQGDAIAQAKAAGGSATTSAQSAKQSQDSAAASASSATAAATSAKNSGDSATAAATSASTAGTKATEAGQSASAAATAKTAAETAQGRAGTSATNAAASETNAAGSASSAATQANVSATSANTAINAINSAGVLPSRPSVKTNFVSSTNSGRPETIAPITFGTVVSVGGEGDVLEVAGTRQIITTRGWFPATAGRTYKVTARYRTTADATSNGTYIGFFGYNSSGNYTATRNWSTGQSLGTKVADGWVEDTRTITITAGSDAYLRGAFAVNSTGTSSSNATMQVASIRFEDITAQVAAEGAASAAATSASTASTKATEAGQAASAAQTSQTAAETARSQANTFANNASTSATNAATSAGSASTSAGVASTSADAALASAANLLPASFVLDGKFWTSGSSFAMTDLPSGWTFLDVAGKGRVAQYTGAYNISPKGYLPVVAGHIYNLAVDLRYLSTGDGGSVRYGWYLYDGSGSLLGEKSEPLIARAADDAWLTFGRDIPGDEILADYPTAAYIRPNIRRFSNTPKVQIASYAFLDVTAVRKAETAASAAATSASSAGTKADAAGQSANAAAASATSASTSAGNASTSASNASTSETNALGSKNAAATSAFNAAQSASTAGEKATAASNSASSAASSATNAGTSASAANTSKTAAETAAGNARTFQDNAATSANTASSGANTASTQAGVAADSAKDAKDSATAAASSASTASTRATEAGQAATSATTAQNKAETAQGKAEAAQSSAAKSETNAAGSANSASSSASTAATHAGNAKTYQDNAATSASTAASNASIATDKAAAATNILTLSASVSGGLLTPNPDFVDWSGSSPAGWNGSSLAKVNRDGGGYAADLGGGTSNVNASIRSETGNYPAGDYAAEVDFTYISGSDFSSAGINAYVENASGDTLENINVYNFATRLGSPVVGKTYRLRVPFKTTAVGARLRLSVVNNLYGSGGYSNNRTAKVFRLLHAGLRLATDAEVQVPTLTASVSQQAGAIATLEGKTAAYLQNTVQAGTKTARLSLYAESSPGVKASAAELVADAVYLGNNRTLEVVDGAVRVNGKLSGSNIEAGVIQSKNGATRIDLDNARIEWRTGNLMKVTGSGFGSRGQFLEWVGPNLTDVSKCTEAKARYYVSTDNGGVIFTTGVLLAGSLRSGVQNPSGAASVTADTGSIGSNGGEVAVSGGWSYSYVANGTYPNTTQGRTDFRTFAQSYNATDQGGGHWIGSKTITISATLQVQKDGSTAATQQITQATVAFEGQEPVPGDAAGSWTTNTIAGGSLTWADPARSTASRSYQAVVTRNSGLPTAPTSQRVGINTVE